MKFIKKFIKFDKNNESCANRNLKIIEKIVFLMYIFLIFTVKNCIILIFVSSKNDLLYV